ncbi:MAG TPA: hypothetical protein VKV95_07010 [Terriglobia bacterium]|nr:hypothetical protein [Terriglobia bacterium]
MKQRILVLVTILALMTPSVLPISQRMLAQDNPGPSAPQPTVAQNQAAPPPQYQSARERRSYERETTTRHHYHITKGEVLTLATVAAMPMGIGAIAAGGRGLAIGAIVAGPSTIAAHYIWKHFHSR